MSFSFSFAFKFLVKEQIYQNLGKRTVEFPNSVVHQMRIFETHPNTHIKFAFFLEVNFGEVGGKVEEREEDEKDGEV